MNVGVSALVANQQALTVTGHNIANVSTPGYSRQTVATKAIQGQNTGSGFIGKGVQVATVMRHYSDLLGRQANAASAASSADAIRYQSLMQMQDIYSGGDGSLGAAINDMMNAFADVESAPADGTARNTVLTRMNELAARFRSASATLQELDYSTKQQLQNNVILVNDLARQVASLNGQIARSLASGHQPNDLLDARDQLVREINQYIQTSQVEADDGSISLFVGAARRWCSVPARASSAWTRPRNTRAARSCRCISASPTGRKWNSSQPWSQAEKLPVCCPLTMTIWWWAATCWAVWHWPLAPS